MKTITDVGNRFTNFALMIRRLPLTNNVNELLALLETTGLVSRKAILTATQAGARQTYELGGEEAIYDVCRAITDVGRWYP